MQSEDGLPQNAVTAIVQTHDGFLWIGTYGGLVRFDGVQFTVFDGGNTPELQNSRVTALAEDPSGTLWIGHETGDVTAYRSGQFRSVKPTTMRDRERIIAIATDRDGDSWFLGQGGILERARDGYLLGTDGAEVQVSGAASLADDRHGGVWVRRGGAIWALRRGKLEPLRFNGGTGDTQSFAIGASADGGLWAINQGRIRKWNGERWSDDWGPCPWGQSSVTALVETAHGQLAVGTLDHGLYLLSAGRPPLHFSRENGLPHDWVRSVCEDREGNLWVGAGSSGLVALRPARVHSLNSPDHWQGRAVLSIVAAKAGGLWIGTEGAGLYRLQDGKWSHFAEGAGLPNLFVWSVAEDRKGRTWVGTWGGGLLKLAGERFELAPGFEDPTASVTAFLEPTEGDGYWVGTGAGLLHYQAEKSQWFGRSEGLVGADVRVVASDRQGVIWFGMAGGGLGRLEAGSVRQFRKRYGLSSDFVQCLAPDVDGALWIGTADGGLNRLKGGRFSVVGTGQGLRNNAICQLVDDGRGFFWIGSHGGIMRAAKADLNRCADGQLKVVECLAYGRSDGMPTLECSGGMQSSSCRTADGRLWFATSKGLVSVDPLNVVTNRVPPPVVIETILVEDEPVKADGGPSDRLRIPAGRQRFEFRYAGLSFSAPEKVLYRYRLEGLETEWVEAATRREAHYSYLPPGDYTFRVIACNNDGVWNEAGATKAFTVLPFFWQTWWFRALSGATGVSVAGVGVLYVARRRVRHELERAERQRAVERERARIAQDIHDDLGASLTRITLLSQSARAELGDPAQAAADLDRIYGTARELTRAMDEIVWAVNPRHDTLDSLASYLCRFAQDFLGGAGLRCRLDVPVRLPAWPLSAETRHNLFLAFKEVLHNALKHAAASEVRVSLSLEPAAFVLSVEDNGRGFAPAEVAAGLASGANHALRRNGLTNLRGRLESVGGSCEIASQPGRGTRVRFCVQVAPAAG